MKRYIIIENKEKEFVKMINHKDTSFELVFLSDEFLTKTLEFINSTEESGDDICIAWQTKFNKQNFVEYTNCTFSTPINYIFEKVTKHSYRWSIPDKTPIKCKKIIVKCSNSTLYTNDEKIKNKSIVLKQPWIKGMETYKDGKILNRRMKIIQLNSKNSENGNLYTITA